MYVRPSSGEFMGVSRRVCGWLNLFEAAGS